MFNVKFNSTAAVRPFSSEKSLNQYAKKQSAQWQKFVDDVSTSAVNQLSNQVDKWDQLADLYGIDLSEDDWEETIQSQIDAQPCIVYSSEIGVYLRNLCIADDALRLSGALRPYIPAYFSQTGGNVDMIALEGLITGQFVANVPQLLSKIKLKSNVENNLDDFEERFGSMLAEQIEKAENQQRAFDTQSKQISLSRSNINRTHSAFSKLARRKLQLANEQWDARHKEYVDDLKLTTAVELWEGRAVVHQNNFRGLRKWSVGIGAVGLILSAVWLGSGIQVAGRIFSDQTLQLVLFSAASVVYFTLFVWALRVTIRTMMIENHLAIDSSARSAMAHTYLALIKEKGEAATTEERAIVLSALFNPVTDGLIRDDAMPTLSPTGIVASAIIGKNG